jgi:predicted S18 family serine protease
MPYFTEPEQLLDFVYALFNDDKAALGIQYVGYSDENILPKYPAVVVSIGVPVQRELYATRTFSLEFQLQVIIYHARVTASHKTRTKEDMQIAARVRNKLHTDYTLGGGVIFGFVRSERPGVVANAKGQATVSTVITWSGSSRAPL